MRVQQLHNGIKYSLGVLAFVIGLSGCGGGGGGGSSGGGSGGGGGTQPVVSTLAGAAPYTNGTGTAARFNMPDASVVVGGSLYVADFNNNQIRKIVIATGVVTTLAGNPGGWSGAADGIGTAATFNGPLGITADSANLYVVDSRNHKLRKIEIATGVVSSLTGVANTAGTAGAVDGPAATAKFNFPVGIVIDVTNTNLYVTDSSNHKIRKIVVATGAVSSLTGVANTAGVAGAADGAAAAATFNFPTGITSDGTSLYVADQSNHKLRQVVIGTGAVASFTGTANTAGAAGAADGAATTATFNSPVGITTDGTNLYVVDGGNHKIRQVVIASGAVSSFTGVANTAGTAGATDGGAATATFSSPRGVATDGTNLYVSDSGNNKIRQVAITTGTVGSLAGTEFGRDDVGAAATFKFPSGVTTDGTNLYVTDTFNHTIRKTVIATGVVTTLAGKAGVSGAVDSTGAAARFNLPWGITTDGTNLYVADYGNNKIRKIVIATGAVSSFTGSANMSMAPGAADGGAATATFNSPSGITADGANLYVADKGNHKVRKIVIATGVVSSLTGAANMAGTAGAADGGAATATFSSPRGIVADGSNIYVSDSGNNKIRKIIIATGAVSSFTGVANTASAMSATDGAVATATFSNPGGIIIDASNSSLYVADTGIHKIRKIAIGAGMVNTFAGVAGFISAPGSADGAASVARFHAPEGIVAVGSGLYVVDTSNSTIRFIH